MKNGCKGISVGFFGIGVFFIFACTPKVYVIDRQTVLQESAAGEWPQFEKTLVPQIKQKSPTKFSKSSPAEDERGKRLYRVLNGEMGAKR
jgi:hypothetical protein